jgi:two-component system, cell cycle response regulator
MLLFRRGRAGDPRRVQSSSRLSIRLAIVLVGLAVAATLAHATYSVFGVGKPGLSELFDDWVYHGALIAASLACVLRGLLVRREHAAWLVIAAGLCTWTLGDVYWNLKLSQLEEIPYPSIADAFYIAGYPALYVGIAMLARSRARRETRFDAGLWLDGLLGGLAVAAIGSAFVYPALQGATEGNVQTVAVNLAYPLGDLLLLSFVVGAVSLTGWRLDRGWALMGGGLAVTAIADVVYLQQEATVGYTAGMWPDTLWLVGTTAIAGAAWTLKASPKEASVRVLRGRLVLPALFALFGGVGILMYGHFEQVSTLSTWLSGATLLVVLVRMTLAFEENLGLLRRTQVEALVDPLTGLGNRRRLLRDLDQAAESPHRRVLVLFDLDGFKAYNDAFGHPAGDALLARLGQKLQEAAEPSGRAYRLGGDEFCVLSDLDRVAPDSVLVDTTSALWETGQGFSIGSSRGAIVLPDETSDPTEAIRLADQRMYAQKNTRPRSPRRQTIDVLLRTLQEREPGLGSHVQGVVHLALAMGRRLGLDAEDLDVVARGAELHDVGKMAVPDAILRKPGPLNDQEWQVMRTHTLIGERILAAAPALAPVATLVRSSHERWDGSGYPDELVGEEIPIGARIIAVCDAFEAMVEDRPWRTPMSALEALAELRRCAGSQFDPRLVEVFAREVYPELVVPGVVAPASAAVA